MAASSSFAGGWKNDVFLSFRGEDTRNTFTSHLYHALCRRGIDTFIDDKLLRGEEITPSLLQEIEGSRISLVVFSKDYASSTFCLDELLEILKCKIAKGQKVLPIFYHVDPSEVRKQGGGFGEAFAQHEARFARNISKVQRWRIALANAANLSGWHLNNSWINEAEFIQGIVKRVLNILNPTYLHVAEHPVGLEPLIQDMERMLSIESNDICMIGMYGLGGIGKTTLAKAVYNKIVDEFEASCFLKNVRETSDKLGVAQLQENLLYEILGDKIELMGNCDRGIMVIKKKLCSRKLLIVVDDVSDVHQLQKLAGATHWFGAGSRIVITTTDEHVLVAHGVEKRYQVKGLSHKDALELFSWKAFKEPQPREDFMDLSHRMVRYADGHPLALEVLGSFLCGRDIPQWESELDRLKRGPKKQIYDILKRSYDCLDHDDEKAIFLDIACFFKSMRIDDVMMILDACDFNPIIGIPVLIERSLILIDEGGMLRMHDLIQSMGRQVAQQQYSLVPGGRRLCFHDDIVQELTENTGVSEIEGIKIDVPNSEVLYLKAEVFAKLKRLRIFIVYNAHIAGHMENLPNLRLLELSGCSLELFSSDFHPSKLVSLNMRNTNIRQFGDGFKDYLNLKSIGFWHCELLTEIPDLSTIPNLVKLDFEGCENLVKIHPSIGYLERLVHLTFYGCSNLRSLPSSFNLKSLETLDLDGCSKLENFPDASVMMKSLTKIYLGSTGIKDLPSSIENLVGLELLDLSDCKNLACIPSTIFKLSQLNALNVSGCSRLVKFPEDDFVMYLEPDILPNLEQLDLHGCENLVKIHPSIGHLERLVHSSFGDCSNLRNLPSSFSLKSLETLDLSDCSKLENFPNVSVTMKSLTKIHLGSTSIKELPSSIENLVGLEFLNLSHCKNLACIPSTIFKLSQLIVLDVSGCSRLVKFPEDEGIESGSNSMMFLEPDILPNLEQLDFHGCENLVKIHPSVGHLGRLLHLTFNGCSNLRSLPSSLSLKSLETLDLGGCSKLENFPNVSAMMKSLRKIYLGSTGIKDLPSSIENLVGLEFIDLSDCRNLACIPSAIVKLSQLKDLNVSRCSKPVIFPEDEGVESGSNSMMYLEPDILPTSHQSSCLDADYNNSLIDLVSVGGYHSPKVDLPMISNFFLFLKYLNLSGQNFVSLPTWIFRLTTLQTLTLLNCQRLQEIPELPPSITYLSAGGCKSLEKCLLLTRLLCKRSFYFDFINCHKLAENQGKALMRSLSSSMEIMLENEGLFKDSEIEVVLPGSDIPKWLSYYSEEDYLSFKLPSYMCKILIGLAFFIILRLEDQPDTISIKIMINGQKDTIWLKGTSYKWVTMELDHLWFCYFPCLAIKDFQSWPWFEQNHFELSIEMFNSRKKTYLKTALKKWGVFLVCEQDKKVSDLRLIHEDINASVEASSDDDEPMCKRKRTMNCNIMDAEA